MNMHRTHALETVGHWLLALFIFFLPLQTRWIIHAGTLNGGPWEYGTYSLYGTDLLLLAFLVVAAVVIHRQRTFRWSLTTILACTVLFIAFVSTSVATEQGTALFWFLQLAKGVLLFIALLYFPLRRIWISAAIVLAAILQTILAWAQFLTQQVIASSWLGIAAQLPATHGVQVIETTHGRILRAYGSLPHPNMLAGFLVVAILVCVSIYITYQKDLRRIPFAIALCVLSTGLWITFSRQAIVGLLVAIVVLVLYIFFHERTFPKSLFFGVLFMLLPMFVLSAVFPELITHRVTADTRLEQRSLTERLTYMDQTTVLLRDHWVTGVGIGNFTAATYHEDAKKFSARESYAYQPVHTIYLLIFSELGVFGICIFFLLLFSLWYERRLTPKQLPWMLACSALLTIGLFDHYLWSLPFGIMLFWIVAALWAQDTNPT